MSLLVRLCLLVAIAALPALAGQISTEIELRHERNDDVRDDALRSANNASVDAERIVEGARSILRAISELPFVLHLDATSCGSYLTRLVDRDIRFSGLLVVDASGAALCADARSHAEEWKIPTDFYGAALRSGALSVFEQGAGPAPRLVALVGMPFVDDERHVRVAIAAIDLDWFRSHLEQTALPAGAQLAIADHSGRILISTSAKGTGPWEIDLGPLSSEQVGERTFETDYGKSDRIVGVVPIDVWPMPSLQAAVSIPKFTAFAAVEAANRRDFAMIVVATLVALLAAILGGRHFIRRPIEALTRAANRWQQGDYDARAGIRSDGSEISRLAVVFDSLAAALEERQEETRRLHRALEARVRDRTRDLQVANEKLRREMLERERTESALRQAQKMEAIGQLTGGIAHDFNNILGVVMGNLELLGQRFDQGDAATRKNIAAALGAANRATRLIQQLLAFARRQQLTPRVVDLNHLVLTMADFIRHAVGRAVTVECDLAPNLWPIKADVTQTESALLNLAVNARDAMPKGGPIAISTRNARIENGDFSVMPDVMRPGDYVVLTVSDSGVGMSTEIMARAFEPFFTTKEVGQGSGLGLSMVYGFVRQSAGHVRIESREEGGTSIMLYLPRVEPAEVTEPAEAGSRSGGAGPAIRTGLAPEGAGRNRSPAATGR